MTQAEAKGNLNIIATGGNINSQGAQLAVEGDALLHAKDNINLNYVTDRQDQTANSKQSGLVLTHEIGPRLQVFIIIKTKVKEI